MVGIKFLQDPNIFGFAILPITPPLLVTVLGQDELRYKLRSFKHHNGWKLAHYMGPRLGDIMVTHYIGFIGLLMVLEGQLAITKVH